MSRDRMTAWLAFAAFVLVSGLVAWGLLRVMLAYTEPEVFGL